MVCLLFSLFYALTFISAILSPGARLAARLLAAESPLAVSKIYGEALETRNAVSNPGDLLSRSGSLTGDRPIFARFSTHHRLADLLKLSLLYTQEDELRAGTGRIEALSRTEDTE